jgi:ribosomal protein L16/L10AE
MEKKIYKKYHKKINIFKNEKNNLRSLRKGLYGLKLLEAGIMTIEQLETIKKVISRITKRMGKIFINVVCNHPLTKKKYIKNIIKK